MKTPEEIKKGLLRDGNVLPHECEKCAYGGHGFGCVDQIERDALDYIHRLESQLAQVERERDAAVEAVEMYPCFTCKNISSTYCKDCLRNRSLIIDRAGGFLPDNYEWRGVCDDNTEDKE